MVFNSIDDPSRGHITCQHALFLKNAIRLASRHDIASSWPSAEWRRLISARIILDNRNNLSTYIACLTHHSIETVCRHDLSA
jgi:hypothetical protein